jgi:hypothetical protein
MGMWSRICKTFRGGGPSAEIREELEFHLHMDTAGGHESSASSPAPGQHSTA